MNVWLGPSHHRSRDRKPLTVSFFLAMGLMLVALVFGGASRLHAVPLAVVELACLPVLGWSLWRLAAGGAWRELKWALAILVLVMLVPLLQLIPLPAGVWRNLPGREAVATTMTLAGLGDGARPFTLAPHETWKAWLALLPPAAMFLATVRLGSRERLAIIAAVLVLVAINLGLGVAQSSGGEGLRPYAVTNPGAAVGLFANRNHFAVLLVISLPLAALWMRQVRAKPGRQRAVMILGGLVLVSLVIIGVIMGRSRAGVGLLIPSMIASAVILWKSEGPGRVGRGALIAGAAVVLVAALALAYGLGPLMERFGTDALADIRFAAAPEILRQGMVHLPLGSGIGSFEQVYQSAEPVRFIMPEFLNHAHDDYLELWLETGMVGLVLLLAFFAWWGKSLFRSFQFIGAYPDLARVGAAITGILLLHSLVDYPLRTPALAVLFAFGLGLLATPEPIGRRREAKAMAVAETDREAA